MNLIYSLHDGFKDKSQLGNKGANLVVMAEMGLPVPPAFILSIEAYKQWRSTGMLLDEAIAEALSGLEKEMRREAGEV